MITTHRSAVLISPLMIAILAAGCGGEGSEPPGTTVDANGSDSGAACSNAKLYQAPTDGDFVQMRLEGSNSVTFLSYGVRVSRSDPPFCDYVVEFDYGAEPGTFGFGLGGPVSMHFASLPPDGTRTWPVEDHATYGPSEGVSAYISREGEGTVMTDRTGDIVVITATDLAVYTLQDVKRTFDFRLTAPIVN